MNNECMVLVSKKKTLSILPGTGLAFGVSMACLGLIVLIPLSLVFVRSAGLSPLKLYEILFSSRALAAFRLSFGAALLAAVINSFCGFLVAWVLARYPIPGKTLVDALVDLPFALPTAVAGISLTYVYSPNGWIGKALAGMGISGVYSRTGIVIALTFIGLPFVVRTVQPVLKTLAPELEESAACLGASRLQTFSRVLLPALVPAVLTGFALAFARALGEYGSVVFISGNMPMRTEIVPLLIMTRLEEYDYASATALAAFMLCTSFLLLLLINFLQGWSRRNQHLGVK